MSPTPAPPVRARAAPRIGARRPPSAQSRSRATQRPAERRSPSAAAGTAGGVTTATAEGGAAPATPIALGGQGIPAEALGATAAAEGGRPATGVPAYLGGDGAEGTAEGGTGAEPPAVQAGPELLMPEPPQGLSEEEQQRINQVERQAGDAASATSAMPPAEENVAGARASVEEPEAESNARAAAALTEALGKRAAPSPEIEALCERIQGAIRRRRPPDEDSLLEFDPREATQAAGDELNTSVQGQSEQVRGDYDQLQEEPSGEPTQEAQPLAPPSEQVETPEVTAEAAVPDPVPAEDVSLDADVAASEARVSEAGMTTEPAELISDPDNPVTQAREGQSGLAAAAARDPQEVMAEQTAAREQARGAMHGLQARTLAALQASRAATAGAVGGGMVQMGTSEAQMRTQASAAAQTIFNEARDQVRGLLEPLAGNALERWQSGITVLSTQVEQESERFNTWKRERYEGIGGTALQVVEVFTGLPDWAIDWLNGIEENFGRRVCNLLREISVEVNTVIATCEEIISNANTRIAAVFDALPESLQEWAAGEQATFSTQLEGLREEAHSTRADFNRQISQEASQAVQSVRERIHTMREEAQGLLGQIANAIESFIEDPAKFIIEGLLKLVGISPAAFWGVVNRIGQVIDDIADDPLGFANNLASALGQGFSQFFDNFGSHILSGFFEWLFSGLGSVGVQLPADFSLGSLITFFLQLMGITWERIRGILARHIGEENVALLERAYELIAVLIEQGPVGIFEMIKEQLNPQTILDQILSSAVDFLIEALIRAVTPRIIAMFNPAGAIVQAIEVIFRILKWIFENAARIFSLVETVVNGAAELIAGNFSGMANAVEGALARLISPVIDFLAGFLGLGSLPDRIADTIRGFQETVLRVIDRVVAWIAQRARALLQRLGFGGEEEDQHEDPIDPRDHATVATRAANELQRVETLRNDYDSLRADKEQQARQIEERYGRLLEAGIGLSVRFGSRSSDMVDQDVDFEIIIAPNTTTKAGSIPLAYEIIVVSVADVHPPGASAIGSMRAAPEAFIQPPPSQRHGEMMQRVAFERHVADELSRELGTAPLATVRRGGRPALEGGALPSAEGQLPFRFFSEPKLNLGGERSADDLFKRPDLIVTAPHGQQQIELFEVTLDCNFQIPSGTRGGPSHKQVQISGSLLSLMNRYEGVPIILNIRCPHQPSDEARDQLNTELRTARARAAPGQTIQIIWRYG